MHPKLQQYVQGYILHQYNNTDELFVSFYCLFMGTYITSLTADTENVHHLLKDKHLPISVCFVQYYEAFMGSSLYRSVSVPLCFAEDGVAEDHD
jgi:hypothetical protein